MLKKISFYALLTGLAVLAVLMLTTRTSSVLAAGPYRMVLSYYDNIQITYEIKYPVGDSRGGWEGPEDVPVGGAGIPGTGNFTISDYISKQIYCTDPFTPFHNRVPASGGQTGWTDTTTDTISGYVEATPWTTGGAKQLYADEVRWIVSNGYRGAFTYVIGEDPDYASSDPDGESAQSVARLNSLFSGRGVINNNIDREIALMATKVAIWKVIAGDDVAVEATTLDGRAAADGVSKRQIFDDLVNALVSTSKNPPSSGNVPVTTFELAIDSTKAAYDSNSDAKLDYYGPFTVIASLNNPRNGKKAADMSDMPDVLLTLSGPSLSGVGFADASHIPLTDEGVIFGTDGRTGIKISADTSATITNQWVSKEFYLSIPKSRANPPHMDRILIQAKAMIDDVDVLEGTPVLYTFANGGVHDWDAIQAFIGAAGEKAIAMYAQAQWDAGVSDYGNGSNGDNGSNGGNGNNGDDDDDKTHAGANTVLGELNVQKRVLNGAPDADYTFTFAVYYSDNAQDTAPKRLELADHPVYGALSVDTANNTFTLKNGGVAHIKGVPVSKKDDSISITYYYWVKEISVSPGFESPEFSIDTGKILPGYTVKDDMAGPFMLDDSSSAGAGLVKVSNTYMKEETGDKNGDDTDIKNGDDTGDNNGGDTDITDGDDADVTDKDNNDNGKIREYEDTDETGGIINK